MTGTPAILRTVRLAAVVIGGTAILAAGAPELTRPGYSPDEEFTIFAVRGIAAGGLPLLPSGSLYDRGIAYSYAAWLAAEQIPATRLIETPHLRVVQISPRARLTSSGP